MTSAVAKDMEKHLAGQIEDLLGRFLPVAGLAVSPTELAMIVVHCGVGIVGNAMANIAAGTIDGLEPVSVGVLAAAAHERLDKVALMAIDLGMKRKAEVGA